MGIRRCKPTSAGRRFVTYPDFSEITRDEPYKPLTLCIKKRKGRNNQGKVTSWLKGGGNRKLYRIIDFKRDKHNIPAKIVSIEYDPNRSARIALLKYIDGEYRYILAPDGLQVGDTIMSGSGVDIKVGNAMPLREIPLGAMIHNIEIYPGAGGKLVRSAGVVAQLMAKEGKYAHIKLPSGEVRLINVNCLATIGQISNLEHENVIIGKAGRTRHLGRRPSVRGVAMNPIDHPLGGGEGKASGGRPACTPWGKPEGIKTRKNKRTDKFIIKRRESRR
ncbi:MAG TPA: 50S ribosomal protein L2 [Thermodesulfovibrio thiophilus]|uniref:50S ribosomal protein L2 n=1 Tax=Thermodesulfovibrio thiophilus TaxID=340095 RepID=UPI0017D792A9|nr:50S ribosomal protein L2 [Thermodesulfovibrio thiophilus]HHW20555.1 50S ribosomal protein L2 [Thermodesulfovibrio thiophilus]HOA83655.1 50S ribosomal protein L2 [Thermodesulfovibrio thiophilus]HQA04348.1 50S ribosomal protein L2 [Thermodesulfovibrio thiophilus]HQD36803.1 50S ribosomal protein L2 [Thermodesulfovibrio thiophilus]